MRLGLGVGLLAVLVAGGCASAILPSPSTAPSSGAPASPAVSCLGGVPATVCAPVADAALAAVAGSGRTPVQVWINSGFFCPRADCLFDPNQNFPYPQPPTGGEWVANAEIAFGGTAEHAGLHVARVDETYVPVLIGYRVPLPGWCSGSCPSSSPSQ
jgi:hypothetical protein